MYSIQIGNNTYVDWCDDKWYGTTTFPVKKFTKNEVLTIVQQLQNHFKYKVIAQSDTETLNFSFGKAVEQTPTFKVTKYQTINQDENEDTFEMEW